MAKSILAWSKTGGQFYREIGKRENGRPVRFYLGADENQALARVSRLEALWNGVVTWWNDLNAGKAAHTEFACWDETTLALGRAIGRGEWSVTLDPPRLDTDSLAVWLSPLRIYFPMIQVLVADPSLQHWSLHRGRQMVRHCAWSM